MDAPADEHARTEAARWRWVRWLFATVLLGLVTVLAFTAWADPYDLTGAHRHPVLLAQSSERATKVGLFRALPSAPRLVLLGSSSTRRVDPAIMGETPTSGTFNFAVQNGLLVDYRTLGGIALDRWHRDGVPRDARLVLAIDPYRSFSDEIELDPANVWVGAARAQLSRGAELRVLRRSWSRYVTTGGVRDSWKVLRDPPATQAVTAAEYLPDGYLRRDPYKVRGGKLPAGTPSGQERLQADAAAYRDRVSAHGDRSGLGRFQLAQLDELLDQAARLDGVHVTLVLMPANPRFRDELRDVGFDERTRAVRRSVADIADDRNGLVSVVDLSNPSTSGVTRRDFQDHVHLNALGMRLVACAMQSRGAFGDVSRSPVCDR